MGKYLPIYNARICFVCAPAIDRRGSSELPVAITIIIGTSVILFLVQNDINSYIAQPH